MEVLVWEGIYTSVQWDKWTRMRETREKFKSGAKGNSA